MKLSDQYRPRTLGDIAGQPPVKLLCSLAAKPDQRCLLLSGPPGVGKSTSALALATELGSTCEFSGLHVIVSTELTIDSCRDLFHHRLQVRPMTGKGWHVVILEELEYVSPTLTRFLKVHLETLPPRCIVVATSNDTANIDAALKQRFRTLLFQSGPTFAQACGTRLQAIWQAVAGTLAMPAGWHFWGWSGSGSDRQFSMRSAIDDMEEWLILNGGLE